jgi:rhodanese-related sulfurtransferase
MVRNIERGEVQRLAGEGAQLVEVLPKEEYEEEHLPGAINLPLRRLEAEARDLLGWDRPIIVYCWDDP